MRIITIGLGGAGCRIADSLYSIDRRSSRVACIQSLAVDVDEQTLQQLTGIPDSLKLYFPPFDPGNPDHTEGSTPTATIDIAEIVSRIHNFESGENDAIFICCGLGGRMADIVPHVIAGLRASITDPIFGLITLPCLAEGAKRSSKAADDIDILFPLLDGMILFDNETWYKKIHARPAEHSRKERGLASILGFGREEPELSPEMETYLRLNDAIVRRISLILKAGEFKADGGIDHAEVVLDSGEVLNTMKGGGFITIGYAVEKLPSNPLAFLTPLKTTGLFNEENKKKASRIVELAKQAIYHEISTPCDMTSAHKALVLVAGPSHEISMQGFMTVRKWIDRSISGIEMRSGDYPVMNTANVAVIIMLSGLENIPRINELREIRKTRQEPMLSTESDVATVSDFQVYGTDDHVKDEMIVLPAAMQKPAGYFQGDEMDSRRDEVRTTNTSVQRSPSRQFPSPPQPVPGTPRPPQPAKNSPVRRPHISEETPSRISSPTPHQVNPHPSDNPQRSSEQPRKQPMQQPLPREPSLPHPPVTPKAPAQGQYPGPTQQNIEQELQRHRMIALSGADTAANRQASPATHHRIIRQTDLPKQPAPVHEGVHEPQRVPAESPHTQVPKRVIIRKRTPIQPTQEPPYRIPLPQSGQLQEREPTEAIPPSSHSPQSRAESAGITGVQIKDPSFRVKDDVFAGKDIRTSPIPKVRDAALLDSGLKPKKSAQYDEERTTPQETDARDEDFLYESVPKKISKDRDNQPRH